MPLDLTLFPRAAQAANELIVEHALYGDADAIERLADVLASIPAEDQLHALTVSELRERVRFLRDPQAAG